MKNHSAPAIVSPIQDFLTELYRQCAANDDGEVATYIPELAKADPDWFGICIVTANGSVYEVGDTQQEFTIQSISKPFVYGLALEDNGARPRWSVSESSRRAMRLIPLASTPARAARAIR